MKKTGLTPVYFWLNLSIFVVQVIVRVIILTVERRPRTVLFIIGTLLFRSVLENRREERKVSFDQSQSHQSEASETKKRSSEPTEGRYH